jgi:methylated-DNA-[protein]-cysteine S-methyltransferase
VTDRVLDTAAGQLEEYFDGRRSEFDLPVALHGTQFQVRVWTLLATLPFGVTTSYAKLAEHLGKPGAARAIGGAVGANPVPIIVPCHRVLGHDGAITGYSAGAGIPTKQWLLGREGVSIGPAGAAVPTPA